MGALLAAVIQMLLPVAVDAAKQKIEAGQVKPNPAAVAVGAVVSGAVQSKTIWVAVIVAIAGFFEQNQGLLSQYIGADKMGTVMMVVGLVMAGLRSVTGDSLHEAGGLSVNTTSDSVTPPSSSETPKL